MKIKKILKITIITLLIIHLIISIYLSIRINIILKDTYTNAPYKESVFISKEDYNHLNPSFKIEKNKCNIQKEIYESKYCLTFVFFCKAVCFRHIRYQFDGIDKEENTPIRLGMNTRQTIRLKFNDFHWQIIQIYENT